MIHIGRGPTPEFFQSDQIKNAKERLQESVEKEDRQERLRFDTELLHRVRRDLSSMCRNKCAYCESSLDISGRDQIDNFRPKAGARGFEKTEYAPMHYWWLAYEWDNLLIACQICNQKYKRDFFPVEDESRRAEFGATGDDLLEEPSLLIDPCHDNPSDHLEFEEGGLVKELSKKGYVTIEILGLNRQELVERRKEVSSQLSLQLNGLMDESYVDNKQRSNLVAYVDELFSEHPTQEFVAIQRTVFQKWFEENSSIWKQLKSESKDLIQEKLTRKKTIATKEMEEISEVDEKITALRRFSIKSIVIENFKSIENIRLQMLSVNEQENHEPWLLLLGDNGIGKSSIIQAIALALAGKKQLDKLQLDIGDFLRRGSSSGKVVIHSYEHDKPIQLDFDSNGFRTDIEVAPAFVLAYGSTRLLPKGEIQPDRDKEPYLNIRNLFEYNVALEDPNDWLKKIDNADFNKKVAPALFDVLSLKENDRLYVEEGRIMIHQFGDDHSLEDNSDGYKSVAALVTDMMQTLSLEAANFHNSYGIVLVDEIGNHLHPRWKLKIAGALRKAFPKLQFIVTSHEPLCLRGLSHGEVVVLVRDQEDIVRTLDKELLPDHSLMRIDQLLTSDLFGLINVLDEETEKTYEEYYKLLSKLEDEKTTEDKNRIEEISSELAEKELLGATPQDQALYKMINKEYAQKLRDEGFRTSEELKIETIKEVKKILVNKKMDWL